MKYPYSKLSRDEICPVEQTCSINEIGQIFDANIRETIFVVDADWHLYGIISFTDYKFIRL